MFLSEGSSRRKNTCLYEKALMPNEFFLGMIPQTLYNLNQSTLIISCKALVSEREYKKHQLKLGDFSSRVCSYN